MALGIAGISKAIDIKMPKVMPSRNRFDILALKDSVEECMVKGLRVA